MATVHHAQHTVTVAAAAGTVYGLIADAANWPRVFPPSVHVEQKPLGGGWETIRIWATANDEVKSWTSRRKLDPDTRTVAFRQEVSQPPVASMGGLWTIKPLAADACEVVLDHDFTAVGDTPQNVAWIEQAVDRNSGAELDRLRATAEQAARMPELSLTFEDRVTVKGSAADVHDFIWDAAAWQERLPHVRRVVLTEPGPDTQTLEMDTLAKDGSQHTTKSVRVSLGPDRIVYKQLLVPALLTVHTGEWILRETPAGLTATSRHTIVVDPDAVEGVLGPDASVADARRFVRSALGANSLATLGRAKQYAEERAGLSKVG